MASSLTPGQTPASLSDFSRSAPAIHSSEISRRKTAPKPRCKPCSKIASALSTSFASPTPKAKSTPSICLVSDLPPTLQRSEEHTSELQSHSDLVCRLLLEKKKKKTISSNFKKKPQHTKSSNEDRGHYSPRNSGSYRPSNEPADQHGRYDTFIYHITVKHTQ